jgi:acyl-CoA synthetase (AMP-forming)/AMP-acid ligase II
LAFNLADLLEQVVDAIPHRPALTCGTRTLTFAELDERANRFAHHLASRGIGPGDHVALMIYNSTEYLEGMFAAFKLRAVPVNVNYRYVADELRYLLDDSDSRAIVFDPEFEPLLAAIAHELPALEHYVRVGPAAGDTRLAGDVVEYDTALARSGAGRDFGARSGDDRYIIYTGGTTGRPKGVVWRQEDVFFAACGGSGTDGVEAESEAEVVEKAVKGRLRVLPAAPLMHGTAHWLSWGTLLGGGSIVLSHDHHFDPVRIWELLARERANLLLIVGDAFARPLVEALPRLSPGTDVSCCRVVISGGAVLSPVVKAQLLAAMPTLLLIDGVGASETGGQGTLVSVAGGAAVSGLRFAATPDTTVLDDDLRPAPVGAVGKLARRGRVPLGYYKDPAKSAATFPVIDGVRWAVPGDHARLEADGSITLLGRGSASINTGGEKVYPEEVEAALKSHDAVFDAVVVGVPDERWGERVVALVALRPDTDLDVEALAGHLRLAVAGYKTPRAYIPVLEVRRSASGKPDYRWARAHAVKTLGITLPD